MIPHVKMIISIQLYLYIPLNIEYILQFFRMKMIITSPQSLFLSLLIFWFTSLASGAASQLPQDEEQALRDIGKTLGKNDWDFTTNPCLGQRNWVTPNPEKGRENNVSCDCSFPNDDFCHVVAIVVKEQNLKGRLPLELINLPYLQEIDLTRNYLNGTIPKEWGTLNRLLNISLLGNRLSGSIPAELGNMSSLKSLVLEFNNFSGNLPPELGNLTNIERLLLTSNNFTGELPKTFSRLTKLKDVRLGDNQFSGSIPNFIQRWTSLKKLIIQGSGFSGPIPSGISFLQNMQHLMISDLNGSDSTFPNVTNMKNLETLILRSCNINDTLPKDLGDIKTLEILDLSYNKLRGEIPATNEQTKLQYLYLTRNLFTGPIPAKWNIERNMDLSYNYFSNENPPICEYPRTNLFASFSKDNNSGPICGQKKNSCRKTFYSFHINCGGKKVDNGSTTYDADLDDSTAAAISRRIGENWAISSTGHIVDNGENYNLEVNNKTGLSVTGAEAELYMNARVSPLSLTYYGFCLENGNYTVKLHFAEIMFTDNDSFSSLGRRVFDVYIQDVRVLKDFNIENEAHGIGKPLTKTFPAINVSNSDLEIRFYWAGKGTTAIPQKSVYGPLISAISVTSDFPPPSINNISAGAIVGIVAAAVVIVVLIAYLLWLKGCLGKRNSLAKELKDLHLQTGLFTLRQIKAATNNFDISNKIGEGGFGPVYKGTLSDGTTIAVKQLSSKSKQGNREFVNEIGMISALQHPYLVKLYGCCVEGDQLLLVYEYMENNSLAYALFGPEESRLKLNWPTRHKICVGIARGLAFLHEESRLKIVHRDIKATNVLLDKDLNPKISDFGLAKLDEEDNTHISTRIAGTYGYMAPEYAMHGYLTDKADVYSFGIVALEIVSGKSNTIHRSKDEALYLLNWAHLLKEKGNIMELVDQSLGSDFNEEEAMVMIKVALLCTNVTSNLRPSMSSVVSMLEGGTVVPEFVSDQNEVMNEMKLDVMRQYYHQIEQDNISKTQTQSQSLSIDGPWTASSSSATDLYPIHPDSSYWEKRN